MPLPSRRVRNLQSVLIKSVSQTGPADLEVQPQDVLHSTLGVYELQYLQFTGCFSNVAKCKDVKTKDIVAVKIFKKRATGSLQPNRELAMLKMIRGLDPENIVRFFEDFEHKGHTCLVFEMLDKNLHELLKERRGNRFSLLKIRPIAQQLLTALESLKTAGIIHTNIRPRNIMLTRQKHLRVKLIGFGSAIAATEVQRGVIMQPVAYRSPDVILGLPVSEAVDVWSLGGVLATMFLGSLPFPQRCQYDQVKTMVETLGQPEDTLLSDGAHTLFYFSPNQDSTTPAWRLNTVEEYKAATGFPAQKHSGSSTRFKCLNELVMLNPEDSVVYKMRFVRLLGAMLRLNPQKRITPSDALHHPFITLTEPYGEEVVAPAQPSSSDGGDVPAVCSNDTSVGVAVSAQGHSGDAPAMTGLNEASKSTASEHDILTSESMRAVSAPAGGDPDAGAPYDQATDATAGSAGYDDEAAVFPAPAEATDAPVTTDLYDVVSADECTVTADEASTASPMTKSDEGAVYSPSDTADAHVGSDGVSATGSRN
ncbi:homeodomain-interacting protein kinase 2-like [Cyclopterus lumpus]|uniref:homeodomain-interacting protein kinase 2-like n=1 Tax=Cyclopterus lumpus TaxID=8103 RepID=UPI0014875412|nr:homeodomain-interacting protein kinase 2-like [Cyclopterus lumpus]